MRWGKAVGVLRERRFAWYFAARTVSTAGTAMAPVALAFAVLHLTDSAGALAQVLTARTAAMVLFLLVGGVVSDRMSRTTVLQLAHGLTAMTQGAAAALVISGHADLWMITGIEAVNGAASAFTFPAMAGIVPLIVDRARLQPANSLLAFSRSGLTVIGPGVAGLLVVTVGPGWALAFDAGTYLVAILASCRSGCRSGTRPRPPNARRCSASCATAGRSSRRGPGCGSWSSCSGCSTRSTSGLSASSARSSRAVYRHWAPTGGVSRSARRRSAPSWPPSSCSGSRSATRCGSA